MTRLCGFAEYLGVLQIGVKKKLIFLRSLWPPLPYSVHELYNLEPIVYTSVELSTLIQEHSIFSPTLLRLPPKKF